MLFYVMENLLLPTDRIEAKLARALRDTLEESAGTGYFFPLLRGRHLRMPIGEIHGQQPAPAGAGAPICRRQ